jgi:uncharacterized membrane protein
MSNFCHQCGATLPNGARFCPSCGTRQASESSASPDSLTGETPRPAVSVLPDNWAALLIYLFGFVSGIIFLNLEPYRRNPFLKFHAWQSILFSLCWFGAGVIELGGAYFFFLLGFVGWIAHLALFVFWIILLVKAYNQERYKLPILGDLAETQANRF